MLTNENYYEDKEYCSASQYKDFMGTDATRGCEARALAKWKGEWEEDESDALYIGSYVDSCFEGKESFENFKKENPQIFLKNGELKAPFKHADVMINRALKSPKFLQFMSGEKQKIVTGTIGGVKFKGKLDSYIPDVAIVDLKTCQSLYKTEWCEDAGKVNWIQAWGYVTQLAIYRELIKQETGKELPCYIAAITKEKHPRIKIIHIPNRYMDEAIIEVETNAYKIDEIKKGEREALRCEHCDYCADTEILTAPISMDDLYADS